MASTTQNDLAKRLKALHTPGKPLVLANCYDAATAQLVINHSSTKAVATASFAIAATRGIKDADLTFDQNLEAIRTIAAVVAGWPLTVDVQDGYDIPNTIRQVIEAGAVGANIEDEAHGEDRLRDLDDAVERVKSAKRAAEEAGVPDFCINARTDTLIYGGTIEEAIVRGKAFLAAGATTVYVWGGRGRGVSRDEVKQLVDALGGMVNVKMDLEPGFLNAKEIAQLGVARISIGPSLYRKAMANFEQNLDNILEHV